MVIARPLRHGDEEVGVVRLEGKTRSELGANVGDDVLVGKARVVEATEVAFRPVGTPLRLNDRLLRSLREHLANYPLSEGCQVVLNLGIVCDLTMEVLEVRPQENACLLGPRTTIKIEPPEAPANSGETSDETPDGKG